MGKSRFDFDAAELRRMYVDEQMPCYVIAKIVGCNDGTLKRCLIRHGIEVRSFAASCKTERRRGLIRRSKLGVLRPNMRGELNPKNGRTAVPRVNKSGRPGSRWAKEERPRDSSKYRNTKIDGRSLQVHRLVAEAILCRPLSASEEVHHVNECRSDNRPANLWVFPSMSAHAAFHKSGDIHPDTIRLVPYCGDL
jgi:hypothetical protein